MLKETRYMHWVCLQSGSFQHKYVHLEYLLKGFVFENSNFTFPIHLNKIPAPLNVASLHINAPFPVGDRKRMLYISIRTLKKWRRITRVRSKTSHIAKNQIAPIWFRAEKRVIGKLYRSLCYRQKSVWPAIQSFNSHQSLTVEFLINVSQIRCWN